MCASCAFKPTVLSRALLLASQTPCIKDAREQLMVLISAVVQAQQVKVESSPGTMYSTTLSISSSSPSHSTSFPYPHPGVIQPQTFIYRSSFQVQLNTLSSPGTIQYHTSNPIFRRIQNTNGNTKIQLQKKTKSNSWKKQLACCYHLPQRPTKLHTIEGEEAGSSDHVDAAANHVARAIIWTVLQLCNGTTAAQATIIAMVAIRRFVQTWMRCLFFFPKEHVKYKTMTEKTSNSLCNWKHKWQLWTRRKVHGVKPSKDVTSGNNTA